MKRIAIVALIALSAMALVGVAAARWTDAIGIQGDVQTSTWIVALADEGAGDLGSASPAGAETVIPYDGENKVATVQWEHCNAGGKCVWNGYRITFVGWSNGHLTWHYRVERLECTKNDLSHWALELCAPGVTGAIPLPYEVVVDPTTGIDGIKWDTDALPDGGDFSFTLADRHAVGIVEVAAKAGNGYGTGNIAGPDCEGVPPANTGHTSENMGDPVFLEPREGFEMILETVQAAPGYQSWTEVSVTNGGSVPVRLRGLESTFYQGTEFDAFAAIDFWEATDQWYDPATGALQSSVVASGSAWGQLSQLLGTEFSPGYQLHGGHSLVIHITFTFQDHFSYIWEWSINWDLWFIE